MYFLNSLRFKHHILIENPLFSKNTKEKSTEQIVIHMIICSVLRDTFVIYRSLIKTKSKHHHYFQRCSLPHELFQCCPLCSS
ncbi:hypothetical protein EXW56_15470 [Bacillus mycoides]|nr:hypothetical protein EXW56_15470 [Bacillus mycoides]